MSNNLLLEIGSDEIPARYLLSALEDIKKRTRAALEGSRLTFDEVDSWGTPRRLVVHVKALSEKSLDATAKVRGPSKKVAFDTEGNPTKALIGFSRSLGVDPADVVIEKENGGEYVYGLKHEPGQNAAEILPEILPSVVMGMNCPHPLRWGEQNWSWFRPIRWVLCMYGSTSVPMSIAGVESGQQSFGHRTLHPGPVKVPSSNEYFKEIKQAGVIVDQNQRRQMILEGALDISREVSGKPFEDDSLLDEVTCLCEHPSPFQGHFNEDYLKLPKEVLITVMRHHQRYFPVLDSKGNVLPMFVAIRDGSPDIGMDNVRKGNEWVLRARLEDASFFFSQDLKTPLQDRIDELKGVYFLRGAGTLYEKTQRLADISAYLVKSLGSDEEMAEAAIRAARLCKGDLVTSLVRELPELEGVMGGYYAAAHGESQEVSKAISQHYLPRGTGGSLPDKGASSIVALADKIDTLSAAFLLGLEVSGSQDPLGLRRAASGAVGIILSCGYDLNLHSLLTFTVGLCRQAIEQNGLPGKGKAVDEKTAVDKLNRFLLSRVEAALLEQGFATEIIRGVLSGKENRISRLPAMVEALSAISGLSAFSDIVTGWRRSFVLSKETKDREVLPELLVETFEKDLYELITRQWFDMDSSFENREYAKYLLGLASLRGAIDSCLDNVLIMAEDDTLKQNRLRLLGLVSDLFTRFADFSFVLPLVGKV